MTRVVIIGCGFAGLTAARMLSREKAIKLSVIDKKRTFDFLPMLPDIIGREIRGDFLKCDIRKLAGGIRFEFIQEEALEINIEKKEVRTSAGAVPYDYLIISSGSDTNFYGNNQAQKEAFKLDSVYDGIKIKEAIKKNEHENYLISGAGYTGIEIATNMRMFLDKNRKKGNIIIVEKSGSILGPLPEWMKGYVNNNLSKLAIKVFAEKAIDRIDGDRVYISDGSVFNRAMVIWSAGVKTPDHVMSLGHDKTGQGRLFVDKTLKIDEHVFAVGDSANVIFKDKALRMAVQFSIAEGAVAAINVINRIKNKPLKDYNPIDLGYIIPMANNLSCGIILGLKVKGRLATVLHYIMCIYRSCGLRNKLGIIKDLLIAKAYSL